ncbi:MAG TPA: hypothetical protein PK675_03370 [Clostridia bacterium]|nr:hypothetical protein [Clostridia bacterium]
MEKGPSTWGDTWTSDLSEELHFNKHARKMGYNTKNEYTNAAKKLANAKGNSISSFRAKNGSTYIYDSNTNQFLIISKNGNIVTFFSLSGGEGYFDSQFNNYGDYLID